MAPRFVLGGPDHQVAFLATVAAAALILARRQWVGIEDRRARRGVALALLGSEVIAWLIGLAHGQPRAPLQLCDLALLLTVWALWSLHPAVSELAYFWALGGSLQAVLTPDLQAGFPDVWCVKFFLTHCGVILSVVYLAASGRIHPRPGAIWRAWLMTNLYAVVAGAVNWRFGTNYGYLAHKPLQPSLLDYFGPWPWYIIGMEVAALAVFALCAAPLAWAKR